MGSSNYVESLDVDALKDIALYLNFDMIGSPNPGYFTYDGDQSAPPDANQACRGCRKVRPASNAHWSPTFKMPERPPEDTHFDGRSDYDGFTQAGVPAGGIFSGAEDKMTAEQAKRWGGQAGEPFDPNYHKKTDTFEHIDRTALEIQRRRCRVRRRASTRRIKAAATVFRSATTAPATRSSHDDEMGGRGRRHRSADFVFVC